MKHAIRTPSPDILAPEIEKLGEAVNRLAVEVFQLTTDIEKELTQKSALLGAAPDAGHMARSMSSASVVSGGVSSGAPDSALEAFPTEIPFPEPGADASVISADSLEVGEHQRQTTGTRSVLAIGLTSGVALLVAGFLWTGQGSGTYP